MKIARPVLDPSAVYRLWQTPFAAYKLAPRLASTALQRVRRVLDVGCVPGANTHLFAHAGYLGIEVNPNYVAYAQRKSRRPFVVADVTAYEVALDARFDFILLNNFLHHIETPTVRRVLAHLRTLLSPDGHIHIFLPARRSIAVLLAWLDRGDYPLPLDAWHPLLAEHFDLVVFEPYALKALGVPLRSMVCCKGRATS